MALTFYNTRSRRQEVFEPLVEGKISIYVCGITVYDRCHVGHARSLIFFDTIVRYLRWRGYDVTFVRNITDIEDKIINRAAELGIPWEELTENMIGEMHRDVTALGCLMPDIEPRATQNVPEMLDLIRRLEERGLAYVVGEGDVYFSVGDFAEYGGLSGRNLDDMLAGARVDVDDRKRSPADFALWKSVKPGEPSWPSPWGAGRPGWHLECSAMSAKHLGQPFDIHGGGEDLVFPHHENELAQSCGATGEEFVRYWLHHAFVRIDQEKMSKSLGNVFAIQDVLEELEPEGLRLHLLSTHYRSPLDFNAEGIADSTTALKRMYETMARAVEAGVEDPGFDFESSEASAVVEAMDDDFNTAKAVGIAFESGRELRRCLDGDDLAGARRAFGLIRAVGAGLGLFLKDPGEFLESLRSRGVDRVGVDPAEVESLIEQRLEARRQKDFATSDRIRDELAGRGILLEDGPDGTTWRPA